jgi:hypothetical protein
MQGSWWNVAILALLLPGAILIVGVIIRVLVGGVDPPPLEPPVDHGRGFPVIPPRER